MLLQTGGLEGPLHLGAVSRPPITPATSMALICQFQEIICAYEGLLLASCCVCQVLLKTSRHVQCRPVLFPTMSSWLLLECHAKAWQQYILGTFQLM